MAHEARVTVLGSINVDTILSVAALPGAGETVMAHASARLPGGKGANQAVAAARMGASVAMIGAVGDDADGAWMRGVLAGDGVDVAAVQTLPVATGAAYIAVDRAAENLIVVAPGANAALNAAHLPATFPGVLLAQLEVPVATVAAALAHAEGLRVLNAAPAARAAAMLFAECDVVIVNEHELACYADTGALRDIVAVETAARPLLCRPGQTVVVTLGAAGALAVFAERAIHVPARQVVPVDTVGAGDCFCGALAAELACGIALAEALETANAAAALCTLSRGAVPAMPRRAAVTAMLAEDRAPPIKNAAPGQID